MEGKSVRLLVKDSLLAMVEASVGSTLFRTLYADVDGERKDILRGGEESCAYFVSVLLHTHKLIESPHATISGLVRDMESSGWEQVETPEVGDIIIWKSIKQTSDEFHSHCGFYMGNEEAISNNYSQGLVPTRHHYTEQLPGREIIAVYRHAF